MPRSVLTRPTLSSLCRREPLVLEPSELNRPAVLEAPCQPCTQCTQYMVCMSTIKSETACHAYGCQRGQPASLAAAGSSRPSPTALRRLRTGTCVATASVPECSCTSGSSCRPG